MPTPTPHTEEIGYVKLEYLPNYNLEMTALPDAVEDLQEMVGISNSEIDLLEPMLTNGWEWVPAERIGALTDAPIICDPDLHVYAYMGYQVYDLVKELAEGRSIIWQYGGTLKKSPLSDDMHSDSPLEFEDEPEEDKTSSAKKSDSHDQPSLPAFATIIDDPSFYEKHNIPEGEKYFRESGFEWGDYIGNTVTRANYDSFLESFHKFVDNGDAILITSSHNEHDIAFKVSAYAQNGELASILNQLEDYPALDDEMVSKVEQELIDEYTDMFVAEFRHEIDPDDDLTLSDGQWIERFNETMEKSETQWVFDSATSAFIDVDRMVKYERGQAKEHGGKMSSKKATGEMSQEELDERGREEWPLHYAIADALGGTVKPFDQYQGPYIQMHNPSARLFISAPSECDAFVWNETTDASSSSFFSCSSSDISKVEAVAAAEEVWQPEGEGKVGKVAAELNPSQAVKKAEGLAEDLKKMYLEAKPLSALNNSRPVRQAVEAIFDAYQLFNDAIKVFSKMERDEQVEEDAEAKVKSKKASKRIALIRVLLVPDPDLYETGDYLGVFASARIIVNGKAQNYETGGVWSIDAEPGDRYLHAVGLEQIEDLKNDLLELGFSEEEWNSAVAAQGGLQAVANPV